MSTTVATSPPSSSSSDNDSSSSLEIYVNPMKMKEKLAQAQEEAKKAKKGDQTDNDGTKNDGRPRNSRIARLERIIKARKTRRAQFIQNLNEYFQKPHVRRAYEEFRRDLPPEINLCSEPTREDRLGANPERQSPPPH